MRVIKTETEKSPVVFQNFDDLSGARLPVDARNLIAENPLVSREDSLIFILLEDDLIFHAVKLDRFGLRSNKPG